MENVKELNTEKPSGPTATRKDLQLPRRAFHMGAGVSIAAIYHLFLEHQQAVYILGTVTCLVYIADQIRVNYPELSEHFKTLNNYIFRAEEQLKESAGVPFVMGLLLTLLSFPKSMALIGILTLAISDPLSAIIGIRYGKRRVVKDKSLEGSLAFLISCFIVCVVVLSAFSSPDQAVKVFGASFLISLSVTIFEMIPIRIDDNLTIPLVTAFSAAIWCGMIGIVI